MNVLNNNDDVAFKLQIHNRNFLEKIGLLYAKNFIAYDQNDERLYYSIQEYQKFKKDKWDIYDAKNGEHLFEFNDKSKITTHPRGGFIYKGDLIEVKKTSGIVPSRCIKMKVLLLN